MDQQTPQPQDRTSQVTNRASNIKNSELKKSTIQNDSQMNNKKSSEIRKSKANNNGSSSNNSEQGQGGFLFCTMITVIIILGLGFVSYNNPEEVQALIQEAVSKFVDNDDTFQLTNQNFQETLEKYDHVLVKFYAPWCGHCKKMAPEYNAVSKIIDAQYDNVKLAKLDATVYPDLANQYEIKGYPTLKWFTKNAVEDYTGGRNQKSIYSWVLRKTGKSSKEITTEEALQETFKNFEVLIIFFTSQTSGDKWEIYQEIINDNEMDIFVHVLDEQLKQKYNAKDNQFLILKKFDEKQVLYNGEFDKEQINDFIHSNKFPTMLPFQKSSFEEIFQRNHETVMMFAENEKSQEIKAFQEAAKQLKGDYLFIYGTPEIDHDKVLPSLREFLGFKDVGYPNLLVVDTRGQSPLKYISEIEIQGWKSSQIIEFIQKYKNGELQPNLKSQPEPLNNPGPVIDVVGKTFDKIVTQSNKDVLLLIYAPWCGHCKNFKPEFEEAARQLQRNPNIVLAQIDYTQNEVVGVQVQGYPTILYFPSNGSQYSQFNGARSLRGIIEFLKIMTNHPWVELEYDQQDL